MLISVSIIHSMAHKEAKMKEVKSSKVAISNLLIKMICTILCFSLLPAQSVLAHTISYQSAYIGFNTLGPFEDLISWLLGDDAQLPEMSPFYIEKGHYVYRGGELLTSYELSAPLYIESNMEVCSSISAKEIIIDADVNLTSKNKDGKSVSNSKLISEKDLKIKKSGSISMDKNTSIIVGQNLESKSDKNITLEQGKIFVQGNLELRNNWKSNENCIIKIDGAGSHVLKGDNKCSVGMLVFSENALYTSKIKKPFWFWKTEPEIFEVVKFSIKLPDAMIIKDNSSEISKTLNCMPMQSNTPYHITSFAKNYLYTVLYCNGNMGNISIDLFDIFFNVKTNGTQIDSVSFQEEKAVYLDAQRNVHCVKMDLSYLGTRNSKESKSIGFGEIIVKDGGQNYRFEFYPILDNVDDDLNGFVSSLRKGASEAIKDQAKDIVFGQAISDLADLSAPDMYDLEIGSVVCEAHSMYKFLDELQSFTKKFNKMKNGLVLEPDTRMQVQATEEHAEAANTLQDEPVGENENNNENKDNTIAAEQNENGSEETNGYTAYKQVIDTLESDYGSLTLTIKDQYEESLENITEVNGLCYLSLIDFNNDGVKELLAVSKHEKDPEYTVMAYTEENGQAVQLLSSTKLTDASWTGDYLCLLSDKNNHTFIDRRQWGSEWDYDEIYGYEEGGFKLISNSCRAYNFEKGEWDNYIVEEVPDVVDPMKLNRRLVSQDEYVKKAPLATGASNTETNYICLAIPDTEIGSGNYYGFDFKALQDSIDRVKEELAGSTASQSVDSREAENNAAYLDVLKKYKGYIKSWERRIKEYNEWFEDVEYLYDERQIAITDINGDGIDELLFVANTDAQTNEGWEEYVKDLYIFTLQNGQASKILQETIYTEAAGGYRYLILKTTDNQLVVLDTGIDEFEDCSMDRYSLQGNHFNKEEHRELYYNPYPYGDEPMYSINMDGEETTVTEREFESTIQSLSKDFETVLIKSGGGVELSIYGIQDEKEAISMTYAEALDFLGGKEDENDVWKQSYIDYIETDPDIAFNPDWCTCGLIYVDDDEIPELIIEYSNEADGTRIVSYKNENIVSYQFSRTGGIGYIEREGLVHNSIGAMGSLVDEFVFLDDKGFHDYGHGYRYGESQDFTNFTHFIWNDEEVSEEEYMTYLNKYNSPRLRYWNSYSEEYQNNNYRPYEMSEYLLMN